MQLARKVALNDDQQTCKKAMSRHILVKNTQKKKPAAQKNPPQKKAAQLFSPTAKKGAAHKKGFHPFDCFVFLLVVLFEACQDLSFDRRHLL